MLQKKFRESSEREDGSARMARDWEREASASRIACRAEAPRSQRRRCSSGALSPEVETDGVGPPEVNVRSGQTGKSAACAS